MKAKSITKRVLSAVLCAVMLFSCWVFTAPSASAATAGNYKYLFRVNSKDSVDVGDNKDLSITLNYKKNNGTGDSASSSASVGYKWAENTGSNDYEGWSSIPGYATSVTVSVVYAWTAAIKRSWKCDLTLYVWNNVTNSWNQIAQRTDYSQSGDSWGQSNRTFTLSVSGGTPAATYCRSLAFEKNVTTPTGSNTTTSKITAGAVTDQYGVDWYQNPYIYQTAAVTGFTLNGNTSGSTVTVGSGAMAAASPWQTTYTVGVKANNNNGAVLKNINSTSNNLTATLTATNPKYTVEWYWHTDGNASTTWSGKTTTANVYYNQTPTAPSGATGVTKYYDSAQHHSGGHYNPTAVTNTNYKFYMQYSTNENHKYNYTELASSDANYHVKHTATCSVATCGYSKTENHDYDTTSFSFSQDGTTATATRVCKTNGCKHSQTETATVTSKVKTAATCTEKGWTTYTATSPFDGDTATDSVDKQDIAALGHSWKTSTFEWSNDCSSCTATRECTRNSSHKETKTVTQIDEEEVAASTCTVNGSTKYTAHSPWDDGTTNEKTLVDIPALGHDWKPTVITFAADGKTATATRTCKRDASHVETLAAPVSHVEKTPATCTEKGWTTYTATSPFADDTATESVDKEDIAALGHDWNPVTFEFAADGKTATATRVCRRDGKHVESAAAIMSHAVKTPATCEGDGTTTYTATSPWGDGATESVDKVDIAAIGHSWGDWEDLGENGHRRVCANDASHIESFAKHTYSSYSKDLPEDETVLAKLEAAGFNGETQCYRYCTACNNVEIQNHNYTHETTKEPNCTEGGIETYTCEYCHTSYTQEINPNGHHYVQASVAPVDGGRDMEDEGREVKAYVYFYCDSCKNSYCRADYKYDEESKTYKYVEDTNYTGSSIDEIKKYLEEIPTPLFNDHVENFDGYDDGYPYSDRSSSFKLMKGEERAYTDENTKQDFRFSGSMKIPVDISYKIGTDTDNVITDFGYVYSQDSHIGSNPNELILAEDIPENRLKTDSDEKYWSKIVSLSVVGDKKTTNPVKDDFEAVNGGRLVGKNGAWSGVSYFHNNGDKTYELTFNLVISIRAKNWKLQYAARPYVKYLYHGVEYTVYDGGVTGAGYETYSHSAVFSNVVYGLTADAESPAVQAYCKERIIPHHNDFYPATITTKTDANTDWWKKIDVWEPTGETWDEFSHSYIGEAYAELIAPYSAQS